MKKAKSACPRNIRFSQRLFVGGSLTRNLLVPPIASDKRKQAKICTNLADLEERSVQFLRELRLRGMSVSVPTLMCSRHRESQGT